MLPTLGSKGQGWVALQALVLAACAAVAVMGPPWPDSVSSWVRLVGAVIAISGGAVAITAILGLGRDITPMPKPGPETEVRTNGIYALVRHPIYGGAIEVASGLALATSPLALVPAVALGLLFEAKSRVEERWLIEHDPAYEDYRRQVTKRFIPGVW